MSETTYNPTFPPDLRTVADRVKLDTSLAINCVQIGTIKSYDASKNLATVALNFLRQPADGSDPVEFPTLLDVPCFFLFGGTSFISMPITSGDTCLVLFNDRDIDNWFVSGQTLGPNSSRAHSLSDGIALVGIRGAFNPAALSAVDVLVNAAQKITMTSVGDATITASAGKVAFSGVGATLDGTAGLVEIKNSVTDLLTQLLALVDIIAAITVTCSAPGVASSTPIAFNPAAVLTYKNTLKTLLKT